MTFRLVATDLDGTLIHDDHTISARTRTALAAVRAAGAHHVIVTGRAVSWSRAVFADLGYDGLAVCSQGAQVYHAGEDRLLTSVTLDRQVAQLAMEKLKADLGPVAMAVSRAGLDGEVVVEPSYRYVLALPVRTAEDRAELWAEPILKAYVQHPGLGDDELAARARQICDGLVDVTHAGPGIVELLPPGLGKSVGLSLVARRLGVKAAETIAFGDMPNDLSMLRWAGYGVAMANAHPDLRAIADEVTGTNDEDGVAAVLERLFPAM
ncbi:HAD family hydrolase [Yinghuangia soli]|uniref:Cof-type HAD-IIB family hydrolase n=1 Tax=Yinghuangia soli TaxID=2908204 RepID=A0AA41PV60_9ACTN|nr:HAD family hydrolase [Yinghuangia soli]MCF2526450.1 Cof-type HAD-IIB family hydrolase [Yinghuangia soli]